MASVPGLGAIPRRLAVDAFWSLFGRLEHEQLDFKRGVPDDVRDTIAAMAMTHGGLIVHGVDDRRNVVGCPLSQNTQDRITRIAFECGVDVQVREIVVGERKLTICAVPAVRGRIVTTPDGRLLRRVGGDAQPLRGDALARFVFERRHRAGEDQPLVTVQVSAFDLGAVNRVLTADGRTAVGEDRMVRALADLGVAVAAPPPLEPSVLRAAARANRGTSSAGPPCSSCAAPASALVPARPPPARNARVRWRKPSTAACVSSTVIPGASRPSPVCVAKRCPSIPGPPCGKRS